jgi:hypothetical protein
LHPPQLASGLRHDIEWLNIPAKQFICIAVINSGHRKALRYYRTGGNPTGFKSPGLRLRPDEVVGVSQYFLPLSNMAFQVKRKPAVCAGVCAPVADVWGDAVAIVEQGPAYLYTQLKLLVNDLPCHPCTALRIFNAICDFIWHTPGKGKSCNNSGMSWH